MKLNRPGRKILFFSSVILIVILDQLTKYAAKAHLRPIQSKVLIEGLLELRYAENSGASFSFLSELPWSRWLFVFVTAVFAIVMIYAVLANKIKCGWMLFPAAMILAGGIGNLIDRAVSGFVIDFFNVLFFPAIFNVADIFVTVGAVVFCAGYLIDWAKSAKEEKEKKAAAEKSAEAETGGEAGSDCSENE